MSEFYFDYKCISMNNASKNPKGEDKALDFYLYQDYNNNEGSMCAQVYIPKTLQEKYCGVRLYSSPNGVEIPDFMNQDQYDFIPRDEEAESYSHFAVELEKYKELYMKFRAILSAEDSEINDDDGYLEAPTDIVFSYSDREMQIAVLAERNTQLQGIVNESIQQTFCAGMSAILSDSKWGSEFKREKRSDDSAHLSYVRKANKGSVFDITCDKNGGISIAPMGVILSNGKATISADELRQVHSSCAWADEIGHTFEEIGIPNGSYEEMDATEREKLYDKKNYYKIVTDEESIRFLRLSGYSDEEIEKLGYSVINEEQDIDVSHSSTTQIAKAKEIKP